MRLKKVLANMPEKASLKNIEKTMQQTRKVDLESEGVMALFPKLNWLDISTRFLPSTRQTLKPKPTHHSLRGGRPEAGGRGQQQQDTVSRMLPIMCFERIERGSCLSFV